MKTPSIYHKIISHATGATASDLPKIEIIMREEIFHSTLDWQTREQLSKAARDAFRMLFQNRAIYEDHFEHLSSLCA